MANIRVNLGGTIVDGQPVTFRSPTNCSAVTGLIVYYPNGDATASKTFQFADAHGNNVGSKDLFAADVLVKVILDTEKSRAYVQNADTNAYLEGKFIQLTNLANEKEIFKARYGTTKSAEIEAAFQAGKFCVCVSANGKVLYTLYDRLVATQHFFFDPKAGVVACKNDVWSEEMTASQLIGSPTVAEMNAAIAAIPTPDVSGQISAHNTDTSAHSDIRTAVDGKVSKGGDTMTGALTTTQVNLVPGNGGNTQLIPYANRAFWRTYTTDTNNRRDLVLWSREGATNVEFALQLLDVASGTTTTHAVLHSGNSNKTKLVSVETSPTVNGEICWTYG